MLITRFYWVRLCNPCLSKNNFFWIFSSKFLISLFRLWNLSSHADLPGQECWFIAKRIREKTVFGDGNLAMEESNAWHYSSLYRTGATVLAKTEFETSRLYQKLCILSEAGDFHVTIQLLNEYKVHGIPPHFFHLKRLIIRYIQATAIVIWNSTKKMLERNFKRSSKKVYLFGHWAQTNQSYFA